MKTCDRCGRTMTSFFVSYYNTQEICETCRKNEKKRADYKACRTAELKAIKSGDLNFSYLPAWKE